MIMLAIVKGQPRTLPLIEALQLFIDHRVVDSTWKPPGLTPFEELACPRRPAGTGRLRHRLYDIWYAPRRAEVCVPSLTTRTRKGRT